MDCGGVYQQEVGQRGAVCSDSVKGKFDGVTGEMSTTVKPC